MLPTRTHYPDSEPTSLCSFSLNAEWLAEKQLHTNLIVIDLKRSGIEPTIYHTRDEHDNNYTTDTVNPCLISSYFSCNIIYIWYIYILFTGYDYK